MTDLDHKRKLHTDLEAGNQRSYQELSAKLGSGFQMDTSDVRRECLIETLVEAGILTEEQYLDFEISFHTKVEEALNHFWEQVREQEKQPHLSVVQKPSILLGADGRPLR